VVFEDRSLSPRTLAPAALFAATGLVMTLTPAGAWIAIAFNLAAAASACMRA
jgi:hypothetical protein